jgi:catechol 2,3-dioxygenase-like lactoylglutathione lyase family enzyme
VALRVADVEACVRHAVTVMGLQEVERRGTTAYLTHGSPHHSLQLIQAAGAAVDHVALEAPDAAAFEELRRRLDAEAVEVVLEGDPSSLVEESVTFLGPDGFRFEVYLGMRQVSAPAPGAGVRPRGGLRHVSLRVTDLARAVEFFTRVLDFRVSDLVGDVGAFLRCNPDHHGLALLAGDSRLHHHAWEVESVAELSRLCDLLDEVGVGTLWGPVRHGAGGNVACYHAEPGGTVVEYYADMERVYDERRPIRRWSAGDQRWYSLWTPGVPTGFRERGLPPAATGFPSIGRTGGFGQ